MCAMQKCIIILFLVVAANFQARAQDPITEIIKAGIVKVIKAVDLQVQRWQNETIWLQNAQKTIENELSKLKLQEIADWVERQRTLYADYFDELQQVKNVIATYHHVRAITGLQLRIVGEYRRAFDLFRQDKHFTTAELSFMEQVYAGMLRQSVEQLDQLGSVVQAFTVRMTDAERLAIIQDAADGMEQTYADLRRFNRENQVLSWMRAKDGREAEVVKKMYGL